MTNTNSASPKDESWWSWFSNIQDDQRLQRLHYCRQLEETLEKCENASNEEYATNTMEEFSPGLRMMKYFGWRGILKELPDEEAAKHPIVRKCARERHSVWACRSTAVGCGKELAAIKKCFDEKGALNILMQSQTAYQKNEAEQKKTHRIHCAGLQSSLGQCVNKGAHELLERKEQRKKNEG